MLVKPSKLRLGPKASKEVLLQVVHAKKETAAKETVEKETGGAHTPEKEEETVQQTEAQIILQISNGKVLRLRLISFKLSPNMPLLYSPPNVQVSSFKP